MDSVVDLVEDTEVVDSVVDLVEKVCEEKKVEVESVVVQEEDSVVVDWVVDWVVETAVVSVVDSVVVDSVVGLEVDLEEVGKEEEMAGEMEEVDLVVD